MSRTRGPQAKRSNGDTAHLRPVATAPLGAIALPAVGAVRALSIEGAVVTVELAGSTAVATLDEGVHPTVVLGACRRGERVLVEQREDGLVVIGALRTQPTPGIDEADEYAILARRVRIEGSEEVSIASRAAALALRAAGEVETYADRIISRAEGVHKIIGRMLRLN